jgi:hypothetical protein
LPGEEIGIGAVVLLREEDLHPPRAALGDGVRYARDDDPR